MISLPPRSKRTDTLFPYTTLFRSIARGLRAVGIAAEMKTYDFNAWYEKVQQGEFSLSLGWSEPYPSGYGYHRAMMSTRSEEHTSELQSLMRISYAVFCLKKKNMYAHQRRTHKSKIC